MVALLVDREAKTVSLISALSDELRHSWRKCLLKIKTLAIKAMQARALELAEKEYAEIQRRMEILGEASRASFKKWEVTGRKFDHLYVHASRLNTEIADIFFASLPLEARIRMLKVPGALKTLPETICPTLTTSPACTGFQGTK